MSTIQTTARRRWMAVSAGFIVVALLAALAVGLLGFLHSHPSSAQAAPAPTSAVARLGADEQVATVNGISIPMREFQTFLDKERAATLARYPSGSSAGDGEPFWNRPVDGVTPAGYLTRTALADVVTTTVELQLAAKYKLIADPSYHSFLAAFQAENERRARAIAQRQVVYGPMKYAEANYLDYVTGEYAYELESQLVGDGTLPATDNAQNAAAEYRRLIDGLASHAQVVAQRTSIIETGGCLVTGQCTR